jgi:hypothetical protein
MSWYWVATSFSTGSVSVDEDGIITDEWTAPIYGRFIAQPFVNLRSWGKVEEIQGPYKFA